MLDSPMSQSDTFLSSLKLLDSRMTSMLELREDYHFRETSHELLELERDGEEKEVSGLETKFFSLLSAGRHHGGGSDSAPARRSTTDKRPRADVNTPYELKFLSTTMTWPTHATRVNKWLLHQLRISPMSVLLLRSVFGSSRLRIRDYWRWQRDVMYYWWRDGTMMQRDDGSMISTTDRHV